MDGDLDEFVDEIDGWILDELKSVGCDTAKSVLELSAEDPIGFESLTQSKESGSSTSQAASSSSSTASDEQIEYR